MHHMKQRSMSGKFFYGAGSDKLADVRAAWDEAVEVVEHEREAAAAKEALTKSLPPPRRRPDF